MVTAAVPVEFMVTVCVRGVFTATLPKATLAGLTDSVDTGTLRWMAKVLVTAPALAVSVAVCAVVTGVA